MSISHYDTTGAPYLVVSSTEGSGSAKNFTLMAAHSPLKTANTILPATKKRGRRGFNTGVNNRRQKSNIQHHDDKLTAFYNPA